MESSEKYTIDTREVAHKLAFLLGKTVLFREVVDDTSDSTTATQVLSIRVENTPGTAGHPRVLLYTSAGVRIIDYSREFDDIMVLNADDGALNSLGKYADALGIRF